MNLTKIVKQFLVFTLKEIYSFFLKLFLFFALLALIIIIISVAVVSKQKESINKNYSYIMLSPANLTDDKLQTNLLKNSKQNISFRDLTMGIETATRDQKVKGIIIDLDRVLLTSSNIEELTPKLEAFKKANKKIYAYGSSIDNQNYSLALHADEIIMVPSSSASISITGYHYSDLYMKKLFDTLGINFEVIHIGDFKCPGCHVGLVNLVAVLFNDDAGVGFGDTANNRRIAAHTFRQHRGIGGQLNTGKRHAVEDG